MYYMRMSMQCPHSQSPQCSDESCMVLAKTSCTLSIQCTFNNQSQGVGVVDSFMLSVLISLCIMALSKSLSRVLLCLHINIHCISKLPYVSAKLQYSHIIHIIITLIATMLCWDRPIILINIIPYYKKDISVHNYSSGALA